MEPLAMQSMVIAFEYPEPGMFALESVSVTEVEGGYQIQSIPIGAYELARMDIVAAKPDERGVLRYESLISPSGHSTIHLLFPKEKINEVDRVRRELQALSCDSELGTHDRSVAVDVPPTVQYLHIRSYLEAGEAAGRFKYEEACLGQDDAAGQR